jgi:general secretion pathway protein D
MNDHFIFCGFISAAQPRPRLAMRYIPLSSLLLLLACGTALRAEDPVTPPPKPTPPTEVPPVAADGRFVLEFRGARLGQVLDYLSQQAGYVIVNPVELPAPLTLVAKQPVTAQEAVDALNGVLLLQGFAVIVRQKTLHVVPLPIARQQNLPVMIGIDPDKIPDTDVLVTQVMPVLFATVKDLAENLLPLLNPASATLAANESSNVLILTDTQAHVKRIAAIIQAIDRSQSGDQKVKVFQLAHADAEKVAQIINSIYGRQSSQQGGSNAFQFARGGGGNNGGNNSNNGGRGGGNGSGNGGSQTQGQNSTGREVEVHAAADSGTNSLVVRASPETIDMLSAMVQQLDVDNSARDDVLLYRVRNGKAADLATSLNSLFQGVQSATTSTQTRTAGQSQARSTGGNAAQTSGRNALTQAVQAAQGGNSSASGDSSLDLSGQVRVVADATSNSVMVLSPERNFVRLRKLLNELDQPVKQVLVRVLVAEVTLEKGIDLGVQLTGGTRGTTAVPATASNVFSDFNLFDSALGVNGFLIENTDFRASIRALATNSNFDVLSRPYILTTDNKEATVNVSQEVPIINGSRTDQNNNITTTFDRRDVGIILTVTPQINSEGLVVLDVSQELSALSDQAIPVAADVKSPIINKRTMTTRVLVEHGQTAVIGGLVKDQISETVQKVPLLGDIPLLGALFRRTKSTKTQTELLVFLTPQVVRNPGELADLSRQLRGEMQRLDAAVEKGLLQQHLDQLGHSKAAGSTGVIPDTEEKNEK